MLERIRQVGVSDSRVMKALEMADRKLFVPGEWQGQAYEDGPLPIGFGQTISQPYTVARMVELLIFNFQLPIFKAKVLEIGTGSGWQTAVLAGLFEQVYSVEIIPELSRQAKIRIKNLKLRNVRILNGDGKKGWPEDAPYDAIICGANAGKIPEAWVKQVASGGRIVCPVKGVMTRIIKTTNSKHLEIEEFGEYSFVPLV